MNASPFRAPLFRHASGAALRPGGLELTRRMLALCNWPRGCAVADVGCGVGATLALLTGKGFNAVGFDASPDMVREAAELTGCAVHVAEAHALPIADETLDGVVCECVLSLTPDPDAVVAEIFRVLVPGGGLLLGDMCHDDGGETTAMLENSGFHVRHCFIDDKIVKKLAAQLLWHGFGAGELCSFAGEKHAGKLSYGIWVAQKKH